MEPSFERKNVLVEYSLYLGCVLSNISQLPQFVRSGLTQLLAYPGWLLLAFSLLLAHNAKLRRPVLAQLLLGSFWVLWLLMDSLIVSEFQFRSSIFYSYLVSIFIFLLGSFASDYVSQRILNNLNTAFVLSMLVVAMVIFFEYFGLGYDLRTRQYAYSSKNSVSQILLTSIILLIVRYKPKKVSGRIVRLAAITFELYLLLLLRSRATLVGLIICILVLVLSKETSKKLKILIFFAGAALVVLLLTNRSFNDFVFRYVVFAGRDASDLNELSSGRLSIIKSFPVLISGHYFSGIGPTYFESFPLSAILQFGVVGGVLIIIIALQPLIKSARGRKYSEDWNLLYLVAVAYSINGLFEGLTPFGPGVKCCYMWLLFGILINKPSSSMDKGRRMIHERNSFY